MIDLKAELYNLLPKAVAWYTEREQQVLQQGVALSPRLQALATRVKVVHPDKIRLELVDKLPLPADPELRAALTQIGLVGSAANAITFGYGIVIRRGENSSRQLSHQCRRVQQYERAGSIAEFMTPFLEQVVEYGLWDSPYEEDARQHEIAD